MSELTLLAISPPTIIQTHPDTSTRNVVWIKFPSGGRSFPPVIQDLVEVSMNDIHDVWAGFDISTYISNIRNGTIVKFKPEVITDLVTIPQEEFMSDDLHFETPPDSTVFATYYAYTESRNGAVNMEIPQENILLPNTPVQSTTPKKWHRQRRVPQPDVIVHHYHHIVDSS